MTNRNAALRRLAFSAILLAFPFNPATAQEASAVAERIKAAAAAQGTFLEWTGVTGDASSMVLEGVTVKAANMGDALPVGNVTLSGIVDMGRVLPLMSNLEPAHHDRVRSAALELRRFDDSLEPIAA